MKKLNQSKTNMASHELCGHNCTCSNNEVNDYWNSVTLNPPPIYTIESDNRKIQLAELKAICMALQQTLNKNEIFRTECALLSRVVYKLKNQFRCHRDFQNLTKVKRCLRRYLAIDGEACVTYFSSCLPDRIALKIYLPSRQMLQYLLSRVMGIASLLHKTKIYCEAAGSFSEKRLQHGHSWLLSSLMLAIVARIWDICQNTVWTLCQLYQRLLPFLPELPKTGAQWLPENYNLPKDLATWIGAEKPVKQKIEMPKEKDRIFNLLLDDDEEEVEVLLGAEDAMQSASETPVKSEHKPVTPVMIPVMEIKYNEDDLGEPVASEDEEKPSSSKQRPASRSVANREEIKSITTLDSLLAYIKKNLESEDKVAVRKIANLQRPIKNIKNAMRSGNKKKIERSLEIAKCILIAK